MTEAELLVLDLAQRLHRAYVRELQAPVCALDNAAAALEVRFHFYYGDGHTGSGNITATVLTRTQGWATASFGLESGKDGPCSGWPT